jgi:hypothetical protein
MKDCKYKNCLYLTSYAGFGDLLYQTPTIRVLSKLYKNVDIWCRNEEPFINNPHIRGLYKLDRATRPQVYDHFFNSVYIVTGEPTCPLSKMPQSNYHGVDFFSVGALKIVLRDKEKDLDLVWTKKDEDKIRNLIGEHGLITNEHKDCNFTVINPTLSWKSRTLPIEFYKDLIKKIQDHGDQVVLVGKFVNYDRYNPDDPIYPKNVRIDVDKTLYPASEFPGTIDLLNKTNTIHELAALYALSKININTENGNMVTSYCNYKSWNIYLPTLSSPEYRVPFRRGRMDFRSLTVNNKEDYYPASDYLVTTLIDAPIVIPDVDQTFEAYKKADYAFKNDLDFI